MGQPLPLRRLSLMFGGRRYAVVKAIVMVPIRGSGSAWKVAEASDPPNRVQRREVALEIQGNAANGYHLVVSPAGCFTADYWYETVTEAKESAAEIFGIAPDGWA